MNPIQSCPLTLNRQRIRAWKRFWKMLFTRRRQVVRKVLADMLKRGVIDESGFKVLPEDLLSKRVFQLAPSELLMLAKILNP